MSICRLCEAEKPLCESHLIPAFVFRWMKENGPTPFLRFSANPGERVQDGLKSRWLCSDCEVLLNGFETPFSKEIFHKLVKQPSARVAYGPWLLKFMTSLSWRLLALQFANKDLNNLTKESIERIPAALRCWSEFLLGKAPNPGEYRNHLICLFDMPEALFEFGQSNGLSISPNLNRYLLNATEIDIAGSSEMTFVHIKTGPFSVFGMIANNAKWEGSKINVRGGVLSNHVYHLPGSIAHYYLERARNANRIAARMSVKQMRQLEDRIAADPTGASATRSFRALEADVKMFGDVAVFANR